MLLMVTVNSCVCLVLVGQPGVLVWLDTLLLVMEEVAVSLELLGSCFAYFHTCLTAIVH